MKMWFDSVALVPQLGERAVGQICAGFATGCEVGLR